jgi:lipopolysaccharide export system permease protein
MISLIGLPLGLQARPGKKAIGIQAGLAIFILYYILFTFGKAMAEKGVLPIWLAMWTPNTLFFILAIFWIYRVANEKTLIPMRIVTYCQKLMFIVLAPLKVIYRTMSLRFKTGSKKSCASKPFETLLNTEIRVRANTKRMEFHVPECQYFDLANYNLEFKSIHDARHAGFKPCIICKDLIENDKELQS